jgi:NhaP-type Na+/H+ or K+/H+ antiporter
MAVIFWHKNAMERRLSAFQRRLNSPQMERLRRKRRGPGDMSFDERLEILESLRLHWKEAFIIGWSGMRGIVSLAAALSLPLVMADGSVFPQRDTILFLTVSVVILMLIVQGLGLPVLVRLLNIKDKQTSGAIGVD